ncbi:N-acetylmuramoyl-L-alanine amidase [Nocardioides stalactiti]|uniref:N-acetylmuramoyl-L-alanine amidase n=1 Tax=Nocardioides stalactiti TaxID=2755356 RepID=UPI0015FF962B|nr:N-acetylmuramoyl-L-alanine amidase [Nocardioides stalactiti]
MGFSDLPLGRRDLTHLGAASIAVAGLGAAGRAVAVPARPRRRRLEEQSDGVATLDLPLAPLAAGTGRGDGMRTPVIATTRFTVLGVTWRQGQGRVRARWRRESGGWTDWTSLPQLTHGPDRGTAEGDRARAATDLVWTGPSTAVQVELVGDQREPVLALLRPGKRPEDALADAVGSIPGGAGGREVEGVPMPGLLYRSAWNADPGLRNGRPSYNDRIRQVHVHHTVSSNDYARADVPGMIRAMYRYHTQNLGWSDIGYNFLVDRFGRLWEGRAGGPRRAVRGAHTLGFNHASVGVAAIGNFETARVGKPMIRALVRVAAWKLDTYGGDPHRTVWVRSNGSDRFRPGRLVELPTIDGHRDTNETACPGGHLYDVLPVVRRRAARRIRSFRR